MDALVRFADYIQAAVRICHSLPEEECIGDIQISYIASGRHRSTYLIIGTNFVLKFPMCKYGIIDNEYEASVSCKCLLKECYAECCMVGNTTVLCMEFVEKIPLSQMPTWADSFDCLQVGRTKDGRVVAYDFGLT